MDVQPPTEINQENQAPQVVTNETSAVPVATAVPVAGSAAIYPTPTSGFAAPVSNNTAINNSKAETFSSSLLSGHRASGGALALIFAGGAVGVIPLLIFVPSLINSMTWVTVWLVLTTALGVAGVFFGIKSQQNSADVNVLGLMAIVISTVMLVLCLVFGSYYIKLQITINSYKSKYNSNSSLYNSSL